MCECLLVITVFKGSEILRERERERERVLHADVLICLHIHRREMSVHQAHIKTNSYLSFARRQSLAGNVRLGLKT